jgi:hypothetical protein
MRRAHLVVAVAVLLGSLAACGGGDDSSAPEDDDIQGVEIIRIPPYEHTLADVHYDRSPPAGGAHGAYAAPCAFVDEALPEELYVHAMEHGAVWLAYEPTLPAADLAVLRGLTQEYDDVAASPWDDLEPGEAVVATAWGRQLRLDSVDDPRLERFVRASRNLDSAPEAPIGCEQP